MGGGTRGMVIDPKRGRSRGHRARHTSPWGEVASGHEIGGSGRSSEDAEGQHNPGGAKDPWGSGVLIEARLVPTCPGRPRSNGKQRVCSGVSTKGASNSTTRKGVPRSQVRTATLKPYWGKPVVRNFRGAPGNVIHGGTRNPSRDRKGGDGNAPPTGARAWDLSRQITGVRNDAESRGARCPSQALFSSGLSTLSILSKRTAV